MIAKAVAAQRQRWSADFVDSIDEPAMVPDRVANGTAALLPAGPALWHGSTRCVDAADTVAWQGSVEFEALCRAYRGSGGIAYAEDLARLLEERPVGGHLSLARLITSRQVLSFRWHGLIWVPMFQFDTADLTLRCGARQVLRELDGAFDGWAIAEWFVQPNAWLADRSPLDMLDADRTAVLQAARTDRFIVNG